MHQGRSYRRALLTEVARRLGMSGSLVGLGRSTYEIAIVAGLVAAVERAHAGSLRFDAPVR